jgi:hypothetical protein
LDNAQGLTVGGVGAAANTFRNSIYGGGAAGNLAGTTVLGNAFKDVVVGFRLNDAKNFLLSNENTFDSYSSTPLNASVRPEGSVTASPSQSSYGPAARTGLYAIGQSNGTVVSGNRFENGFGGLTIAEAKSLTVNGNNTIEVFDDTGITVYGDVSGTVIENNTIIGDLNATNTTGLRLVDAKNLHAANNTFSAVTTGVQAEGDLGGTVLSDNVFLGANGTTGVQITGSNLRLERNTIRDFSGNGIEANGTGAINNAFLENSIYGNAFGIKLLDGANGNQAAPVPEQVQRDGESLTVSGNLTVPAGEYRLEVFRNFMSDEQGSPIDEYAFQGRVYLGSGNLTSVGGATEFNITLPVENPSLGGWLTLTATSLSGESEPLNTSEFSKGIRIPRGALAVGSATVGYGLDSLPEARLYNVGALGTEALVRGNLTDAEEFNGEVSAEPLLTVSAYGEGASNLAAVYGTEFATSFRGGLRVTNTDLNNDGYDELIVVPAGLPSGNVDTFGSALRTVGIFNSNPNGLWTTASIDLTPIFGDSYTDGFTVTAVNFGSLYSSANPFDAAEIVVSSCLPTGPFNGAVAYTVTTTERGGQPVVAGDPVKTPNIPEPIVDVAAGRFSADENLAETLVVATNSIAGSKIRLFGYDPNVSTDAMSSQGEFAVSLSLKQANGVATDVYRNGLSLSVGDMNNDLVEDLILGAGAGGMGNFRVVDGAVLIGGAQAAFDSALQMTSGPFRTGVVGGRYADFTATNGATAAEQTQNLDYFYEVEVPGFTGQGFNSPIVVRALDVDGDKQTELFVSLGGVNSARNAILHFAFHEGGWIFSQSFRAIGLGSGGFEAGDGIFFG